MVVVNVMVKVPAELNVCKPVVVPDPLVGKLIPEAGVIVHVALVMLVPLTIHSPLPPSDSAVGPLMVQPGTTHGDLHSVSGGRQVVQGEPVTAPTTATSGVPAKV